MRKLMLVAATVAVLTLIFGITTVQAVPGAGDGQGQSVKSHGGLFAKLNLTQDQKNQIKTILTKAHADAKAATDPAAKKAIWKAVPIAPEELSTCSSAGETRSRKVTVPSAPSNGSRRATPLISVTACFNSARAFSDSHR